MIFVIVSVRCGEQCLSPGSTIHKMKASLYLRQLLDLVDKTMPVEVLVLMDLFILDVYHLNTLYFRQTLNKFYNFLLSLSEDRSP